MDINDESLKIETNQQPQHHNNQIFLNYRKNISNDEQQNSQLHVDSAYGSGYNLTTPNVSTSINLNEALTPERNNLNVIHENLNDSINLTPVTQNINRICNFHITTPKSQDFFNTNNKKSLQKIFNTKRTSEFSNNFDNFQSTPKKFKIINDGSELINNKILNSTSLRKNDSPNLKFRNKLHSAPDLDCFFDENIFSPKKPTSNKLPTKNNYRKPFNNLINNNYDKKSTSTPVTTINQNTESVKKLLNFSSEQFNNLINSKNITENHLQVIDESLEYNDFYSDTNLCDLKTKNLKNIDTTKPIKIETNAAKTSFKRFLSFGNEAEITPPIHKLKTPPNLITNSIEDNQTTDDDFYQENSFRQYNKQFRILNTVCNDRLIAKKRANAARLATLEKSYNETSNSKKLQLIGKNSTEILDECLTSPLLPNDKLFICDAEKAINDENDYVPVTPPKRKLSFEDELITAADNNEIHYKNDSYTRNILPTTPKKQKLSNNMQNNINYEKFEIMYPTIPTTPHKHSIHLSPKRKLECKNLKKYKKYEKFYGGALHLNIIAKLELYPIALDCIFDYLSTADLLNLSMVTKTHRKLVKNNSRANRKLNKYFNDLQMNKENYDGIDQIKRKTSCPTIIFSHKLRIPLKQCKMNVDRKRSHSPPVSPSKKKFYENQKVVNTLSENQSISKCPRCAKASRIINMSLEDNSNNSNTNVPNQLPEFKNLAKPFHVSSLAYFVPQNVDNKETLTASLLTQSQPIPIIHPKSKLLKSTSFDTGLLQINMKKQEKLPFQPYGECISKSCNYKFCLDCKCEYHLGTKCKLTTSVSPTKEDIQNGILELMNSPHSKKAIAASRSSKMLRRKSLKRLCF